MTYAPFGGFGERSEATRAHRHRSQRLIQNRIRGTQGSDLSADKALSVIGGISMVTDSKPQSTSALSNPWAQLIVGIICMVMVANCQYGWTLFVGPIGDKFHWTKEAIRITFTLFVLLETSPVP